MFVGPRAEEFNIVSNDHRRTQTATFLFQTRNTLFEQDSSKTQNCQFELKFGTQTNLNMQNSMVMFTFSVFYRKYFFWANFVSKFKIVSLKVQYSVFSSKNGSFWNGISKKNFHGCNLSSIKLYISAATSQKKLIEMMKY